VRTEGSLPQGTVTFLFTDIEGSTPLLDALGRDRYRELLQAHRELLRGEIEAAGGTEVDSQGDSLLAVFRSAGSAVRAAVEAQRALGARAWPAGAEVRVRMGLHTGEATPTEQGYVGIAVHRGRRVCEAAHGGQIVLSSAAHAIIAGEAPDGVRLRDLGEVRLAGFEEPERLFQVAAEDLPEVFPELRAPRLWRQEQPVLLERAEELAALEAAVAAARTGAGRVVVVEGPPGIGKTSLLAEGRARAAASGFLVLQARGSELESAFSFGVVRQLFEAVLAQAEADERARLLEGAAGHAGRLFGPGADGEVEQASEDAAFSVLHGLYWLAANLAEAQPLAIAVDDLQWADPPSLRWLSYLARRIEGVSVCVIGTMRPVAEEDPLLAELLVDPATAVVRPNALGSPSVADVVRAELGVEAEDEFCRACHRATAGNPLLLHELLRTLAAQDVPPVAASVGLVERVAPDAVARSVRLRLSRLSPQAARLARAVAVLGDGADREHAAVLGELERRELAPAAATLARVDLLRQEPPFAFVHPVIRNAVYETLPADQRELEHARAAEMLAGAGAPPAQIAAQVLLAPPASVDRAAAILRDAAARAAREGGLESAASYLQRALDEPMPDEERGELLLELGAVELALGSPRVLDRLEEAVGLFEDPERRAQARLELGRARYWAGREVEAVAVLEEALAEWDRDDDLRRRLQAQLYANATRLPEHFEQARRELGSLQLAADEGPGARMLLGIQAYHEAAAGGSRDHAIEQAERVLAAMSADERSWNYIGPGYALLVGDRLDESIGVLDGLIERARKNGAVFNFAGLSIMRAMVHYARGALVEAEADARAAFEALPHRQVWFGSHVHGWLAQILVERGAVDEAAEISRGGGERLESASEPLARAPLLRADATIALARGDHRTALEAARELGENLAAYGHTNPAFSYPSWRALAIQAQLALGETDEALELAREELESARAWGAPRALGRALRLLGLCEGGEQGLARLREAVTVLEDSPARMEYGYARAALGSALRRANRRAEAREQLRQALELAQKLGATLLAEHAHEELVATGARPRRVELSGAAALTPSERRIAAMAAEGLSNREIAQALFVTLRTVEMHLSNAFRKLGVSSRTQLPAALTAPEAAVVAAAP
jgi:class 3 adenylate cyclase/DNA-binding CsgD family transcriptional regulator